MLALWFLALAHSVQGQNYSDDKPSMVIVAFRPGLQEPVKFGSKTGGALEKDSIFTTGDITSYGKKQSYALGKFLRARYADVVPTQFSKDQVRATSSSSENSQATMQMVLAGLFGGRGTSVDDFDTRLASYDIDDNLLRMEESTCPEYKKVVGKYRDDNGNEVKAFLEKMKPVVDIVHQEIGINASFTNLVVLGANVMHRRFAKQSDDPFETVGGSQLGSSTNLTNNIFEKISRFADAPSMLCANDRVCRRLLAGYLISSIFETYRKKKSTNAGPTLVLLSSPVDTLAAAAKILKLEPSDLVPSPSGGFIVEFRDTPAPAARFILHEPETENTDRRLVRTTELPFCQNYDWCPLETLMPNVAPDTIDDWRPLCKVRQCDAPPPADKSVKSVDCPGEYDKMGTTACYGWAKYDFCKDQETVRWLYCRRTCLCNPEFL